MTSPAANRVVFLGTDDAAAACLRALHDAGLVAAAVTPLAARRGRSGTPEPCVCAAEAARLGVPVIEAGDVNDEATLAAIAAHAPRLLVVVSFGQIMKRSVREIAPLGAINLHYSLLPRWRGAAPVQRAILAGDAQTGAAVQRVVARLDAGAVLAVAPIAILPADDTATLRARLTAVGAPLLVDVARRLLGGESIEATEQDESLVTRAAPIAKSEGDVDPSAESALTILRKVRAFEPWPRCRVRITTAAGRDEVVTIRAASVRDGGNAPPGTVVSADASGIVVATTAGALVIERLQKQGGKDVDARAFLNGMRVAPGDRVQAPPSAPSTSATG